MFTDVLTPSSDNFTWGHAWVERDGKEFDASRRFKAEYYGIDKGDYYKELKPVKTVKTKSLKDVESQDLVGVFQIAKDLREMTDI